jgi:protoporphyrinogen/coproporphyrinogen III oxidase
VGSRGRAVVVGGGVAGLTFALDALEAGYEVTLLDGDRRLGGVVRSEALGPVQVDVGAESFALTRPDLTELAQRLGLGDEVVRPASHQAHVLTGGRMLPLPPGLLGIPASVEDIDRILGPEAAEEAAHRDRQPLDVHTPATIGELVRQRLGDGVADTLVDPVIAGVHATRADDAELASVAPSLAAAMHAHGGLLPAVRALRGPLGPAGSPVASLHGGMGRLVERLEQRLLAGGALVHTQTAVTALQHDGSWRVQGDGLEHDADVLCLAVPARSASGLLRPLMGELADELAALPTTDDVTLVTLLFVDEQLSHAGSPVGSGVLVADGAVRAKAMTHSSAKWGWLAEVLPAAHHVARLSYGGTSRPSERAGTDRTEVADEALVAQAMSDLRILFDGAIGTPRILGSLVTRWAGALSRPVVGRAQRLAGIDERISTLPRLAVTGSSLAGNGLAGVVGRSRLEATRTL